MAKIDYKLLLISCLMISMNGSLSGCVSDTAYAPVENAWKQAAPAGGLYTVKPGDTLYSIAWKFGLDYRDLSRTNNIDAQYISSGQQLRISTTPPSPRLAAANQPNMPTTDIALASKWVWPASGNVVLGYSTQSSGNKGIDIQGIYRSPIKATASGEVVYSGDGIRGYGELIIIKHNNAYFSAYAYNDQRLVKVGETVEAGQVIGKMGENNAGKVRLHFEIRKNGIPTNPLDLLEK